MKDLIAFLQKFRIFMLFAVLQITAIYLYVNNYDTPQVKFLSSANVVTGTVLKKSNEITQFINTPKANKILQEENSKLRQEIDRLNKLMDTSHFKDTLMTNSVFQYLPAQVIYSTHSKRNNFITINKGQQDGIREGMGVFSDKSIVGVVHSVTQNYSIIKSVLSSKIYIDVKIEANGAYGLLNWDGKNARHGEIDGISSDISLEKWQRIVTRGSSGVFPEGLYVGKVFSYKRDAAKSMWNIDIWYEEDFRRLANVYVIKNNQKKQFVKLDESLSDQFKEE